jgi:hypothetical protein
MSPWKGVYLEHVGSLERQREVWRVRCHDTIAGSIVLTNDDPNVLPHDVCEVQILHVGNVGTVLRTIRQYAGEARVALCARRLWPARASQRYLTDTSLSPSSRVLAKGRPPTRRGRVGGFHMVPGGMSPGYRPRCRLATVYFSLTAKRLLRTCCCDRQVVALHVARAICLLQTDVAIGGCSHIIRQRCGVRCGLKSRANLDRFVQSCRTIAGCCVIAASVLSEVWIE